MIKASSDLDQNIVSGSIVINSIYNGIFLQQSCAEYYGSILLNYIKLHEKEENIVEGMELKNFAHLLLNIKI